MKIPLETNRKLIKSFVCTVVNTTLFTIYLVTNIGIHVFCYLLTTKQENIQCLARVV